MKTLKITMLASLSLILVNCKKNNTKTITSETTASEMIGEEIELDPNDEFTYQYEIDTQSSAITWKGFKPTGSHSGTISMNKGTFDLSSTNGLSGTFVIDMNSIKVTDIPSDDEKNGQLLGHLKSADFFDVQKNPLATFKITKMSTSAEGQKIMLGNLSLNGVTNSIEIPITTTEQGDALAISSTTFTIDRSKWNIKYGSKSFFDNLGDKFISNDIELKFRIVATRL